MQPGAPAIPLHNDYFYSQRERCFCTKTKSRLSDCTMTTCRDLMSDLGGLQGLPAARSAPGGLQRGCPRCGGWIWRLLLLPSLPAAPFVLGGLAMMQHEAAAPKAASMPGSRMAWLGSLWAQSHSAGSLFPAAGKSPGSPWELDDGGRCCSPSHLQHGCAATVHGHVVKRRERMGTCVLGCNPALCKPPWEIASGSAQHVPAYDAQCSPDFLWKSL